MVDSIGGVGRERRSRYPVRAADSSLKSRNEPGGVRCGAAQCSAARQI